MKMSNPDPRAFVPQNITEQMEYTQMREAQKRALKGSAAVRAVEELMGRELNRNERKIVVEEGYSPNRYLDTKDIITRGVGQTAEYLDKSFGEVLEAKDKELRAYLPDYPLFTERLQDALFSNNYRGSLGQSKKTRRLINEGKFKEAAFEFLDNDEYRNPETSKGIKKRFEETHKALLEQAEIGLPEPPPPVGYGDVSVSDIAKGSGQILLGGLSNLGDNFISFYDSAKNFLPYEQLPETEMETDPISVYRTVKGDNPWSIAERHGISVDELASLNPEVGDALLRGMLGIGQQLNVRYTDL